MASTPQPKRLNLKPHKMPDRSLFFDKIVPIMFIVLSVITVLLIAFAIGVISGVIAWV